MSYAGQPAQSQWGSNNPNQMPPRDTPKQPEIIEYLCGDCGAKNPMKPGEAIRCKECGHRVLYKPRTFRIVQFEAR